MVGYRKKTRNPTSAGAMNTIAVLSSLRPADDRSADLLALRVAPAVGCAVFVLTTIPLVGTAPSGATEGSAVLLIPNATRVDATRQAPRTIGFEQAGMRWFQFQDWYLLV